MRWLVLVPCLVLMLSTAHAGTADEPEVTDGTGDGTPLDPESARDLVKGWIDEQGDAFRFHAVLATDPTHVFASVNAGSEVIRFGFRASGLALPDGQESYVRIRFGAGTGTGDAGDEIATCRYGVAQEDAWQDILEQVDLAAGFDGQHFWCDVPKSMVGHAGSTTFANLHMDALFLSRGPLTGDPPAGGDNLPPTEVHHYDRAPDSGYGADASFTDAPLAPASSEAMPITLPFTNATTEATTGVFAYNWTGDGVLAYMAEVTGGVLALNVTVNGTTVFAWNGTGSLDARQEVVPVCVDEEIVPVSCEYVFTYTLDTFVGSYGISIANATLEGNATDTPSEGPGTTTTGGASWTDDGHGAGKESPLPLAAALVALVLAARRR